MSQPPDKPKQPMPSPTLVDAGIELAAWQLTNAEDADLAEAEDEIARGDLATEEEVNAMWRKHGG
jgi:hypothetical protein